MSQDKSTTLNFNEKWLQIKRILSYKTIILVKLNSRKVFTQSQEMSRMHVLRSSIMLISPSSYFEIFPPGRPASRSLQGQNQGETGTLGFLQI